MELRRPTSLRFSRGEERCDLTGPRTAPAAARAASRRTSGQGSSAACGWRSNAALLQRFSCSAPPSASRRAQCICRPRPCAATGGGGSPADSASDSTKGDHGRGRLRLRSPLPSADSNPTRHPQQNRQPVSSTPGSADAVWSRQECRFADSKTASPLPSRLYWELGGPDLTTAPRCCDPHEKQGEVRGHGRCHLERTHSARIPPERSRRRHGLHPPQQPSAPPTMMARTSLHGSAWAMAVGLPPLTSAGRMTIFRGKPRG